LGLPRFERSPASVCKRCCSSVRTTSDESEIRALAKPRDFVGFAMKMGVKAAPAPYADLGCDWIFTLRYRRRTGFDAIAIGAARGWCIAAGENEDTTTVILLFETAPIRPI
jgi:hypothetical protein